MSCHSAPKHRREAVLDRIQETASPLSLQEDIGGPHSKIDIYERWLRPPALQRICSRLASQQSGGHYRLSPLRVENLGFRALTRSAKGLSKSHLSLEPRTRDRNVTSGKGVQHGGIQRFPGRPCKGHRGGSRTATGCPWTRAAGIHLVKGCKEASGHSPAWYRS